MSDFNQETFVNALAAALGQVVNQSQKATGVPRGDPYLYELGGLFGRCDGPSQVINAMVGPIGIEKHLEWFGSSAANEFVDALTSITESGSEQTTVCGDCITVALQACIQLYCFGRFCRGTEELQFDRIGLMGNNNVPIKTLFGAITDTQGGVIFGQGEQISDLFYLQSRAAGYALRFKNSQMIWNGNPTNNVNNVYMEYKGFQLLVNTGKFDAYTQEYCTALDAFLMNYANNQPTAMGTYAIANWFRRMIGQFEVRAERAGLDWATSDTFLAMSPNVWDCVSRVYACAGVELCSGLTSEAEVIVSADEARERHQQYLEMSALPIGGRWYPVVKDSQIPETSGTPTGVCSDVYFITKEINGEMVTYGEYQDFDATYGTVRRELVQLFGSDDIAIVDNGRYALIKRNVGGCFDVTSFVKPRIVMKMPWLTGRIQNVCCDVTGEPFPDPTLSGTVYTPGGGRTTTPPPVLYGC